MKLRTQFSLVISILVTLIAIGVGFSLFMSERRLLSREIKENQFTQVKTLVQVCSEAVIVSDDLLLLNYIQRVKNSTAGVISVMFVDKKNEIKAHNNIDYLGQKYNSPGLLIEEVGELEVLPYVDIQGQKLLDVSMPVKIGADIVGTARIVYSQDFIDNLINKALSDTARRIFGLSIIAIIIGIAASILLAQHLNKPINLLIKGSQAIGKGQLDHKIPITSNNELGVLAKSFNIMGVKLKELDEMKDDFVSSVTHELRSPLAAIKGYVNFILSSEADNLTPDQKDYLHIVQKNTVRLGNFIDDVLDVAKIEARRLEFNYEPFSIQKASQEIVDLFLPLAEEKKVKLSFSKKTELTDIDGDGDKIKQVLTNLVSNALKFTPENGSITIEATENKDGLLVGVRDTGIGIPKDQIGKIFDKFQQVKRKEKTKGTGLGLTIVKGIIEEGHFGKIWVESELNKGTIFKFTLPRDIKKRAENQK